MADSQITKKALGDGLKELVRKKGFDKVSVGDITGACGMGRQSFYYHFQDKFELLEWVYYQDAFAPLCEGITLQNWPMKLRAMLDRMYDERKFYVAAIKAQPGHFSESLSRSLEALFLQVTERLDEENDVGEERRKFGASFYALGCCAVVVRWAQGGMRVAPDTLARDIYCLAKDSERAAIRLAEATEPQK